MKPKNETISGDMILDMLDETHAQLSVGQKSAIASAGNAINANCALRIKKGHPGMNTNDLPAIPGIDNGNEIIEELLAMSEGLKNGSVTIKLFREKTRELQNLNQKIKDRC